MRGQSATMRVVRVGLVQVLQDSELRSSHDNIENILWFAPESLAVENPCIFVGSEKL